MCCSLVDGIISQGIGESESAQKKLRPMIANADEAGAYAFSIYGLETLAQSARTEKDKELMKDSLTKALGYRRSTAMRYTQWDAKRLEGVAIVRSG